MAENDGASAWMPLYVADYLSDTSDMDTLEHGAYLLLIMHYWRTRLPLPDDDKRLANIARLDAQRWSECRPALAKRFAMRTHSGTPVWWHKRVEQELKTANFRREAARRGAELTNSRKKAQGDTHSESLSDTDSDAPSVRTAVRPAGANHNHNHNSLKDLAGKPSDRPADFQEFYDAYPRKVKPRDALKAWKQTAKDRPPLPELLAGLRRCIESSDWKKDGGQFISHPGTWLRAGGWDSYPELTNGNGNGHAVETRDGSYSPPGTKRYSKALHAWVPTDEWKPAEGERFWT